MAGWAGLCRLLDCCCWPWRRDLFAPTLRFALHVGILLVCLTPAGRGFALPRRLQAGTSLVAVVLAVGIQYWLMRGLYPQANYSDTQVLQLFHNLKSPEKFVPFLLFLTPFAWTAVMLMRRRYQTGSAGIAVFTAAVLFLGMWVTVGRIGRCGSFSPLPVHL